MNVTHFASAGTPAPAAQDATPIAAAGPTREVVLSGPWTGRGLGSRGVLLSRRIDEIVRKHGFAIYDLMGYDASVACATELWKAGVLADGLKFAPAVKPDPGELPKSRRGQEEDLKVAQDICDAWGRAVEGLEDPIDLVAEDMLDGFKYGCTLAEPVYEEAAEGPDAGRLMPVSMAVKPYWAWNFRVDPFMHVRAIRCWSGSGWEEVGREHFVLFTWKKKRRDPRGHSGYAPAFNPWSLKARQYPNYGEWLEMFADPILALTAGPNMQTVYAEDPVTGLRIPRTVSQQLVDAAEAMRKRRILGLPSGSTASTVGGTGTGDQYGVAFDRCDLEIFRAILFSARPIQESKHGSKADSESSLDLVALSFEQGRKPLTRAVRDDLVRTWVRLNWGEAVAKRFTPTVSCGQAGQVGADLLNAYANAYQKGFVDEAQLPYLWEKLGLPAIDTEALQARLDQIRQGRAAQQEAAAAKGDPAKGQDGDPAKGQDGGQGGDDPAADG